MKLVVKFADIDNAIREADSMPGNIRYGQHVVNKFLSGTALDGPASAKLFYCENSDFWSVALEFISIG